MKLFNTILNILGMTLGGTLTTSDKKQLDAKYQTKLDKQTASASQRKINLERGSNPERIGARRIMRNQNRARKASNRYCNNLTNPGSVGHNPRRHTILSARQMKQVLAT